MPEEFDPVLFHSPLPLLIVHLFASLAPLFVAYVYVHYQPKTFKNKNIFTFFFITNFCLKNVEIYILLFGKYKIIPVFLNEKNDT